MARQGKFVQHLFGGGWDTDSGPTANVQIADVVVLPFLIDAENVLYERDGGPHKMPGTAKLNSVGMEVGDIDGSSYDSVSADISGETTNAVGLKFKSDGTKMYVLSAAPVATVFQYTLATAWDASSASYDSKSFSFFSEDADARGFEFKSDGAKMYYLGDSGNKIYQYTLSTPWDVSTANYDSVSLSVASEDVLPRGLTAKPDGTKMYVTGDTSNTVYQYGFTSAWDLSTASYDTISFSLASEDTSPRAVVFRSDGSKMYSTGAGNVKIFQYSLSTVWNVGTASYDSKSFDISGEMAVAEGAFLKDDDTKLYIASSHASEAVFQYSIGGQVIKGLFDFWVTGATATSIQHRIAHVGTKIKRDDGDGTFTDLFTGMTAGAVPCYAVLKDILVMSSDASGDVPKSWDGSTAQNLAGTPPNFAVCEAHKNRMWAAGVNGNSSRLYYSVLLDVEDWIGAGSGSIDIEPEDGDRITAIVSHRDELWVFKGPYKGSIHRITGSAPTGDDAFARKTFAKGVGAVGQNTIFRFANDLGFMWSDGTVRSLAATDAFGDYAEAALSRPINTNFLEARLNLKRLKHAYAAVDDVRGVVLISIPVDANVNNNGVISMDFRFQPVRWSYLTAIEAGAIASVVDQTNNNRRIIMFGGNDGFVRKWNQATRSNDGASISYLVTTPHLNYGLPSHMKRIDFASIGFAPKNNADVTFGWQRDNEAQQTETVTQGGGAQLGSFVLGTSTLGGASFVDRFIELTEGDEFRSVRYQIAHNVNEEDVEVHSIGAQISLHGQSTEN